MAGTKKGASKFVQRKLAEDPDYFKKLGARRKKPVGGKNSKGSFKKNNPFARLGGKASRRGPAKNPGIVSIPEDAKTIDDVKITLDYQEANPDA